MTWYKDWFDSKYYHLLYKNRDHNEAALFLDNISNEFKKKNARILDVACGKGRHAKYLNSIGFDATGVDLSFNSIKYAKKYENKKLKFHQHDMRNVFEENKFDIVTNLFTSFGYFDNTLDDQKAISSMAGNLKKGGLLLIDFMNVKKVIMNLVANEIKFIEDVKFKISRKIIDNHIIKKINIEDEENIFSHQEKVHCLTLFNFTEMLEKANMKIINLFGDYDLNNFDEQKSDRLIILAKKL
jgi:SAM-dependent methyltransferase